VEEIGKLPLHKFYPLFEDLCRYCVEIRQRSPQAYILPEWVFLNRNSCKIGHFEPFFCNPDAANQHVFMFNLEKSRLISSMTLGKSIADSDVLAFEKKQSLLFNLGAMAYQLLTGRRATSAETEEEYKAQLSELEHECFARLSAITKDEKFS
jgi:hypothetical protein